ncbi:MAG TPA: hypothetical protein VLK30_10205 [Candidatus Limnocylindrales bacterium]|nr:hypothetical protein [Candidatus Limnocylindrales bacterium]
MRLRVWLGWRFFFWWVGIAIVLSVVARVLVDVAYSRFVYFFVVMPIGGVLLFPAAYAANRWLTPALRTWLGGD